MTDYLDGLANGN